MANISFFALGGLDEKEKKCFVLGVENEYFIFNIGISTPIFSSLGIKKIIPDFTWIEKNRNKIKGIFISTANFDNVGGMLYLNSVINKIPVYTSKMGKMIIENFFNKRSMKNFKDFSEYIVNEVNPLEEIKVGNVSITPFSILNNSPNSLGFVFNTNDGGIIILDDFIISSDENSSYCNQIHEINKITKNKNLILISSVGNINKPHGFTSPNHKIIDFVEKEVAVDLNIRNFICCYDHDLFTIFSIIKLAEKLQMHFTIHNNVLYNLIFKFMNAKNIQSKNLLLLPISKINTVDKGIVLLSYNKQKIFNTIQSICEKTDEFIEYKKTDKFILAFPTLNGFESQEANVIDSISSCDMQWSKLPKNILEMKASSEDHKLLMNFIKPKYIIPTSGLYFEFIEYKKLLEDSFKNSKCIVLENGQQVNFLNGEYLKEKNNWIEIQEKYVGSSIDFKEINTSILNERKLMSENGVVFVSILVEKENNKFEAKKINIDSYGINLDKEVFETDLKTLEENILKTITENYNTKNLNSKSLKNVIKKMVAKFYDRFLGKMPLILTTIIDR